MIGDWEDMNKRADEIIKSMQEMSRTNYTDKVKDLRPKSVERYALLPFEPEAFEGFKIARNLLFETFDEAFEAQIVRGLYHWYIHKCVVKEPS